MTSVQPTPARNLGIFPSSSSDIELQPGPFGASHHHHPVVASAPSAPVRDGEAVEALPIPQSTATALERWNKPRTNAYRTMATLFAFLVMGANDAAYGALVPHLESHYRLSHVVVSLVFLSPLVGYAGAALLSNTIHVRFGQRGAASVGPACHVVTYIGIALHPPYPVLVVLFVVAGFGNGLLDAAWNSWVGKMHNANQVLGVLHGFYGIGAVLSPLVASLLTARARWPWYTFYYFMLGGAIVELAVSVSAFWHASGSSFRASDVRETNKESRLRESLRSRVTWIAALFLLGYVGVEVALGGWIVSFMANQRGGEPFASGMVATGFWLGIALGRVVLGFVTPRVGEKLAIMAYLIAAMALQLLFWLVPEFYVSAIAVSLVGFFLGPLFPAAVVTTSKVLPPYLHVSAIGFAAALGGGGAAVFPFAVGALAQVRGVQVLQPIILALMAVLLVVWLCLPRLQDRRREDDDPSGGTTPQQLEHHYGSPSWRERLDIDLIDQGRSLLKRRMAKVTQERVEKREARELARTAEALRNPTAFAVLQGVDPGSTEPPPYSNIRG